MTQTAGDSKDEVAPAIVKGRWDNLRPRIISALVLLPIGFAVIWLGGMWFSLAMVGVSSLMAFEWHRLLGRDYRTIPFAIHCLTGFMALINMGMGNPLSAIGLMVVGAFAAALMARIRNEQWTWIAAGVFYTVAAPLALIWLRQESVLGVLGVTALALAVIATDVGAYFAGKMIGGPKLVPTISPSKTWAGLIGGGILAAIVSGLLAWLTGKLTPENGAMLGLALAFISQTGDVLESSIKRHFKAKDSGHLIPGHGGLLDRFDGLMFATLAVTLVILAVRVIS